MSLDVSTESAPVISNEPARTPAASPAPASVGRDLALVVLSAAVVFALAGRLELYETFSRWSAGYEHWQLDEVPLTLLCLSAGLTWFGWRRWREQRAEAVARTRAEQHAEVLLERNRELTRRMLRLQEEERRALARELHDDLGQCCSAIRADAVCVLRAQGQNPEAAAVSARAIAETAEALQNSVHRLLRRLRPEALDAVGLVPALTQLCADWERRHGTHCRLSCDIGPAELPEPVGITAFRLVQEALTNVARHAQAGWVRVSLQRCGTTATGEAVRVTIQDNGRGFPPNGTPSGLGLLGMRERACAVGGALEIHSAPDRGVRIEATLPLHAAGGCA